MTEQESTGDGGAVLNLQALIRARLDERGWSLSELERRSHGRYGKSRWQQLATGKRITEFPEPASLKIIADVLEVDVTTVVLAAACSLDLPVRFRAPDLAQLLPAGTDRLSPRMRDSILTLIRAAVAETLSADSDGDEDLALEWRREDGPRGSARNAVRRSGEQHA